ncbi:hypothetical protein EW146_g2525 [Bondarzewia mesenterica]|uniref:SCA7 domain-containing protein n=1 Tax=Bondarzewia mesenterica TaxID=1095465 RepID=A0A4S4M6I6_9AGAM|nr:hypothetical protein EW146_g2525 [Bondarzewia mesenterica]
MLKLKPSPAPSPAPFSFENLPSTPPPISPSTSVSNLPSPPTSWLSAQEMKVFGADPLRSTSDIGVVQCKECGKPVLRSAAADHAENCKNVRLGKGAKGKSDDSAKGKKRKVEELDPADLDAPKTKKAKPATKVTKGRFKGPVDLDRQCGVINDKNLPCSRSLTCKSHSMGAKRALAGRSRPYDELLLDWRRANDPSFVEPVKRESKKERKEKKDREKRERKQKELEELAKKNGIDLTKPGAEAQLEQLKASTKKKKTTTSAVTAAGGGASSGATASARAAAVDEDLALENLAEVDSEAELDSMTKSVRVAQERGILGVPLTTPCDAGSWFVVRRERLRNCRDLFAGALMKGGISSVASAGAAARLGTGGS